MSKTIQEKLMDNIAKALAEAIPELLAEEKAKPKRFMFILNDRGFKKKIMVSEKTFREAYFDRGYVFRCPIPLELNMQYRSGNHWVDIVHKDFVPYHLISENILELVPAIGMRRK